MSSRKIKNPLHWELANMLKLSKDTFDKGLEELRSKPGRLIWIDSLLDEQKQQLKKELEKKDFTILMHNCKAGDLSGFAAVSPEGDYVLVRNNWHGRTQQVVVLESTNAGPPPTKKICLNKGRGFVSLSSTQERRLRSVTEIRIRNKDPIEDKLAEAIRQAAKDLMSMSKPDQVQEGPEKWRQCVTLQFVDYLSKDGHQKAFFTAHIEIYATKTNKWIKFRLTDAVGMSSTMQVTDQTHQGYFNHSASIYIFPSLGASPHDSQLPLGWHRPYMEPRTTNMEATYICTTGWSIGGQAGAHATVTGGITAGITASYNNSKQQHCTIPEFKVRNISDGSMTGWYFYYTAAEGEKWNDFSDTKKPLSDLARGTLTFNAECIYEGPSNYSDNMEWSIRFEPTFALPPKQKDKKEFSVKMKIDTSVVSVLSLVNDSPQEHC